MATIATHPQPPSAPKLESLKHINISKFSQSELHALSLCSSSSFDPSRTDDLVVPQINRSIFNESASTRKQTYSRLRLRPPSAAGHPRPRLPNPLTTPNSTTSIDPENKSIINSLKQLMGEKPTSNSQLNGLFPVGVGLTQPVRQNVFVNSDSQIVPYVQEMPVMQSHSISQKKRRRGRKSRLLENGVGMELEITNMNGVVVDFESLANADELYCGELRNRTVGLEKEEEVLGFLRGLGGEWCSRRRKRKIVDANEFADCLPIGWKLVLGLRRREGCVSVYCRRYMSPTGQQFISCKDAASFLRSYFGLDGANQPVDERTANEKEFSLVGIDNLAEVQVQDIFDCHKCNMTFAEKNEYLQHLLSFHQKTTRRYRVGTSVGEGVIIKDGKFECQFCHKVFEERRSYNGHVGVHVRNHTRGSEELPAPVHTRKKIESPSEDQFLPRISKMDALIEIAQNSILETSVARSDVRPSGSSSPHRLNVDQMSAAQTDPLETLGSKHSEMEMADCLDDETLDHAPGQHDNKYVIMDDEVVEIDAWDIEKVNVVCTNNSPHPKVDEVDKYENIQLEIGLGNINSKPNEDVVSNRLGIGKNVFQNAVANSSVTLVQSPLHYPEFTAVSNKGEGEFCAVGQKLENVMGFEELRFDEIEPFSFVNGQESSPLPEVSIGLANDAGMEERFNSSVGFESEAVMFSMDVSHGLTTVCVWCRTEFSHESIDSETQSDSIGFMCPTCKAKISGHLNCGF